VISRHDILTVAEMAAADAAASPNLSLADLIERAGASVARIVIEKFERATVLVLAGPGHNGADGYMAARVLREAGWPVRVAALGPSKVVAAQTFAATWGGPIEPFDVNLSLEGLVIDALFGAGLDRPLPADVARLERRLRAGTSRVVAIDVPSGLSGDTGKPAGEAVFHADITVTFHRKKPGHVLQPGRGLCGEVVVADIGLGATDARLFENDPSRWLGEYPWPAVNAYKTTRGRLVVVSGDAWSTGAARLSARAALRVGAGLVTLLSPPEALMVNAGHLEAVMLKSFETEVELEAIASNVEVAVIGPAAGVNEATLSNVLALARTGAALVVDADALSVFRDEPEELFSALDRDDVLTPHPGEFERIFPGVLKASPERITAARTAAARAQAIVVLKGSDTVICGPDGRAAVNVNGTPWLATAGSGDVLAGLIGGLIAQGMGSFDAACAGVWIHAECGEAFGPGLISEDLPGLVPMVLKRLWERVEPRKHASG